MKNRDPYSVPGVEVFKSVEWSYPTSTNADRFGFRHGCWTVQHTFSHPTESVPPVALSGHATRSEAVAAAAKLPEAWSAIFVHLHPAEAVAAV